MDWNQREERIVLQVPQRKNHLLPIQSSKVKIQKTIQVPRVARPIPKALARVKEEYSGVENNGLFTLVPLLRSLSRRGRPQSQLPNSNSSSLLRISPVISDSIPTQSPTTKGISKARKKASRPTLGLQCSTNGTSLQVSNKSYQCRAVAQSQRQRNGRSYLVITSQRKCSIDETLL